MRPYTLHLSNFRYNLTVKTIKLANIGKCIYCLTSSHPLQTEHIIPYALNGPWILRRATCEKCAAITSSIELIILRGSLNLFRAGLDFQTRRKELRPTTWTLPVTRDGTEEIWTIPTTEYPVFLDLPVYELPAHQTGKTIERGINYVAHPLVIPNFQSVSEALKNRGVTSFTLKNTWEPHAFARFLAKVAYGFAVSFYGLDNLQEAYVLPYILDENQSDIGRYVGSDTTKPHEGKHFYEIDLFRRGLEIIERIRLFGTLPVPDYIVVVGRLRDPKNVV